MNTPIPRSILYQLFHCSIDNLTAIWRGWTRLKPDNAWILKFLYSLVTRNLCSFGTDFHVEFQREQGPDRRGFHRHWDLHPQGSLCQKLHSHCWHIQEHTVAKIPGMYVMWFSHMTWSGHMTHTTCAVACRRIVGLCPRLARISIPRKFTPVISWLMVNNWDLLVKECHKKMFQYTGNKLFSSFL